MKHTEPEVVPVAFTASLSHWRGRHSTNPRKSHLVRIGHVEPRPSELMSGRATPNFCCSRKLATRILMRCEPDTYQEVGGWLPSSGPRLPVTTLAADQYRLIAQSEKALVYRAEVSSTQENTFFVFKKNPTHADIAEAHAAGACFPSAAKYLFRILNAHAPDME